MRYEGSIRLVHLHPSVDDSDSITISVLRAGLSDAKLEYETLSYTWGKQYPKQTAFCRNPWGILGRDAKARMLVGSNVYYWRICREIRNSVRNK